MPTIETGSSRTTIDAVEVPDFTAVETKRVSKTKPNGSKPKAADTQKPKVKEPSVVVSANDRATQEAVKAKAPKKRLTRKAAEKPASSPLQETPVLHRASERVKENGQAGESEKGKQASSELPPPKRAKKLAKGNVELPAGLADLARASSPASATDETPDFTAIAGTQPRAQVDFTAIDVDNDSPASVGSSELDDFFSSQDAPSSATTEVGSAPAINVHATDSPRKLRRDASRKSKPTAADSGSDWKRRGKRISSGEQEFEG